jgi:alkylation response protein AidB-like acyl-CoA dehydrogenase
MKLELTEEQRIIQDTARNFAKSELEPVAAKLDETGDRATFLTNLKKMAQLGLMGINTKSRGGRCRLQPGDHRNCQGLRIVSRDRIGQQHVLRGHSGHRIGRA